MKKTLTGCLLMFLFFSSSAQYTEKTITINGFSEEQDSTIYEYESGPWSTAWSFGYISHAGYRLNIQHEHTYNTCWEYLPLSDSWIADLPRDSYYYIRKLTKQEVIPKLSNTLEPSLQWLLEVYKNRTFLDDIMVSWKSSFSTHWIDDTLHIPDNYSLVLNTDSLFPELADNGYKKVLLTYYPSIHYPNHFDYDFNTRKYDVFEKVIKTGYGTIYTTGNGLLLKKGDKYRWIYINDGHTTGYRGKLRWSPVRSKIIANKDLIAFTVRSGVDFKVYVINLKSNTLHLIEEVLEKTVLHDWSEPFELTFIDSDLSFKTPHGELKIPLTKFE